MSNPTVPSANPLIPSLFQIASRADDPKSITAFKKTLAAGHAPHAEKMMDKGKLEAILDAVTRKKKTSRRVTTVRLEKRLALNESHVA